MNARFFGLTLMSCLVSATAAGAQTAAPAPLATTQPQTPPNAGAAEAQPRTVTGPGGATTLPASGSLPAPMPSANLDPGNVFTASPPAGPQARLGRVNNVTVHYVAGDYIAPPIVYNAISPGVKGQNFRNYAGRFAIEVPVGDALTVYVGGEGRRYSYQTPGGLVTFLGNAGRGFVPSIPVVDYDVDVRGGIKIIGPRIFLAVSGLRRGNSVGEVNERGIGYGLEKLADVDQNFSLHGNVFYYPNVGNTYAPGGLSTGGDASYKVIRYLAGATISPKGSPLFLDAGYLGDYGRPRTDVPVGFRHQGPFVGVGIHF